MRVNEMEFDSLLYQDAEVPFMKRHIEQILMTTHGNISKAAKVIGWAPNTLKTNMERVGIDVNDYRG